MTNPPKPDLLVPDRRVVSIDQAREELATKKERRSMTAGGDFVSRDELLRAMGAVERGIIEASLAMGQKVFDQVTEETEGLLDQMEHTILQQLRVEFERRTLRGRLRALRERALDYCVEIGLRSPLPPADVRIVDPVEALDPNAIDDAEHRAIVAEMAEP